MNHTIKKLDNSQVELHITITSDEYQTDLQKAAKKISDRIAVKGFRKGRAPYEIIKKEVGEMAIMQEALEAIVQRSFYEAVKTENLETIGMPKIEIEKLAPDNDITYKAIVALLPKVTLPDLKKIKVTREETKIDEKQIEETLDAVRGMHAVEVIKSGVAEGTDKLVIDMEMFMDDVPVEGGQTKDHQVYLSEKHYIPGFEDYLKGLKKDEKKSFSLNFPETHYQKHLAGKKVDFKIKVKEVFERQLPELSDELAKKIGQESVEKLKELIRNNLIQEAQYKANQKAEIEILDQLIEKSEFTPIPEVLIDAERQKMFYELKRDLDKHGITIEKYLEDIKKDEKKLFEDFKTQAEKRAKAALISRQVALDNKLTVSEEEIDQEIKMMEDVYKDNKEYIENIKKPEIRNSIASAIQNRKVIQFLTVKILAKELTEDSQLHELGCKSCQDGKHNHDHDHSNGHKHDKK